MFSVKLGLSLSDIGGNLFIQHKEQAENGLSALLFRALNGVVNVFSGARMPQRLYYSALELPQMSPAFCDVAALYFWWFERSVLCGRCQRFTQVPEDTYDTVGRLWNMSTTAKHVPFIHNESWRNSSQWCFLRFWVLGWSGVNSVCLSSCFVNHNETVFSSLLNPAVAEVSFKELKGELGILQGSNLIGMKTNDVSLVA